MKHEAIPMIAAFAVVAACTSTTNTISPDAQTAQAAADTTLASGWDASIAWAAADPIPVGNGILSLRPADAAGNTVASAVVAAAGQNFSPSGCVNAVAGGNVVTFVMNGCSGALGLTNVTGTVTATYNAANPGVQIQLAGNNIAVNGSTINVATQGTLTLGGDGVTRTFQANSTSSGTGPFGNSVARSGTYTLTWQQGMTCGAVNSNFTVSGESAATSKAGSYTLCRGQCPQSGTATHTVPGGAAVTLTFNGTSNPGWQSSDGNSGTVMIRCP